MKLAKLQRKFISETEYLKMESVSPVKHEYFDGEILQMAGASYEHNLATGNIFASLHSQLRRGNCSAVQNDMRLFVETAALYTYPDVMIVCGKPEIKKYKGLDSLLNPVLIVEVLSPSTADYDKGAKFDHYRTIESLREYVLVWQDKKRVARYTKQPDESWILRDFIGEEAEVALSSIDCRLSMEDIYDKVDFEAIAQKFDS